MQEFPLKSATKIPIPILFGRKARFSLEEIIKGGRVGKVQAFGNLVGQQTAGVQKHLGTKDNGTVDPVHRTSPTGPADDCREVVGCDVEQVGIIRNIAFLFTMAAHLCLELIDVLAVAHVIAELYDSIAKLIHL